MKKMNSFKKLIPVFLFLFALATLSSCNRGVGCPSDFSIGQTAVETAVETVAEVLPALILAE